MVLEEQEDLTLVNGRNTEEESMDGHAEEESMDGHAEEESMDGHAEEESTDGHAEEEPNDWDDLPSVDGDLESDDDGDLVSRSDDEEFPYRLCEGTLDPLES